MTSLSWMVVLKWTQNRNTNHIIVSEWFFFLSYQRSYSSFLWQIKNTIHTAQVIPTSIFQSQIISFLLVFHIGPWWCLCRQCVNIGHRSFPVLGEFCLCKAVSIRTVPQVLQSDCPYADPLKRWSFITAVLVISPSAKLQHLGFPMCQSDEWSVLFQPVSLAVFMQERSVFCIILVDGFQHLFHPWFSFFIWKLQLLRSYLYQFWWNS